jgi:hypothetical protein
MAVPVESYSHSHQKCKIVKNVFMKTYRNSGLNNTDSTYKEVLHKSTVAALTTQSPIDKGLAYVLSVCSQPLTKLSKSPGFHKKFIEYISKNGG